VLSDDELVRGGKQPLFKVTIFADVCLEELKITMIILRHGNWISRCRHSAAGWRVQGSNPGRCKRFFSSPKTRRLSLGPHLRIHWVRGIISGRRAAGA
jgi:hypothetical protein